MTDAPDTDRASHGPDAVTAVLLSLYECLVNAAHLKELVRNVGAWLEIDADAAAIRRFEEHSDTLWRAVLRQSKADQFERDQSRVAPAFELDRDGRVVASSSAGADFWACLRAEDTRRLHRWLKDRGPARAPELLVRIYLPQSSKACIGLVRDRAETVAVYANASAFEEVMMGLFAREFGVSGREMAVLGDLLLGLGPREIAAKQARSVETIRNQIKSITGKLGVSTQSDLIREFKNAESTLTSLRGAAALADAAPPSPRSVETADGRRIYYDCFGPADGEPVLHCHCVTTGRHWPSEAIRIAARNNLRIISVSRAGFGPSTENPLLGDALLGAHVADYHRVLSRETDRRPVSVFAFSTGFATAYALALHHPDLIRRVVGLDIVRPILSRRHTQSLAGTFRTGALTALYAPKAIRLMAALAARKVRDGRNDLRDGVMLPGIDLEARETEDGVRTIRLNTLDATRTEGRTAWRELSYATIDWASAREDANHRPQVDLLETRDSPFVVPGGSADFAQRIGAQVRPVPSVFPYLAGQMETVAQVLRSR